jgi:hypothetical protein
MFEGLAKKPVVIEFSAPEMSSDGGVLLLKAAEDKLRLIDSLASCFNDRRIPGKIDHQVTEMFQSRIFGIACGYPDCNDASKLSRDPAMLLACNRRGESLASQPTLSRFENCFSAKDLLKLAYALTDNVIERETEKRKPSKVGRITIDMDPTEDPTYGAQQLTFFRSYYDNWCYLPMITTIQFDDDGEHHLIAPMLRPGNAARGAGALTILKRLVPKLRSSFRNAKIFVRMDGEFAKPAVLNWLEEQNLYYLINVGKNSVLLKTAEHLLKKARAITKKSGKTTKFYGETPYKAGTWREARRTIIKAEVTYLEGRDPRDNPRFVVTNLKWSPKSIYRFYGLRGDVENRIRELKDGLRFDLTSCTSFLANQLRNIMVAAAYILLQEVRYQARATDCEKAQVWTLRERLLKFAVVIRETARRILIEAPLSYAWKGTWRLVAARLGAVT